MTDYMALAKKVVAQIENYPNLDKLTPYLVMFWIGTTKYEVAKAVLDYLEVKGYVKKSGRVYEILPRKYNG